MTYRDMSDQQEVKLQTIFYIDTDQYPNHNKYTHIDYDYNNVQ